MRHGASRITALSISSKNVSIHPQHGRTYEELRRNADAAMYRAKLGTKGGAAFFDAAVGHAISARMIWSSVCGSLSGIDLRFMRSFVDALAASGCAERFVLELTEDAFLAKSQFQFQILPMLRLSMTA